MIIPRDPVLRVNSAQQGRHLRQALGVGRHLDRATNQRVLEYDLAGNADPTPLVWADVITCAANAPTSAAMRWVAPGLAPRALSGGVQLLLPGE